MATTQPSEQVKLPITPYITRNVWDHELRLSQRGLRHPGEHGYIERNEGHRLDTKDADLHSCRDSRGGGAVRTRDRLGRLLPNLRRSRRVQHLSNLATRTPLVIARPERERVSPIWRGQNPLPR